MAHGPMCKSVWTSAAGNTAVWTPASGKRWRVTRFKVTSTANATLGLTGGLLTVKLMDGNTEIYSEKLYLPGSRLIDTYPAAMQTWNTGWWQSGTGGTGALSGETIGSVLNLNLSAKLTAGEIGIIAMGWEDA